MRSEEGQSKIALLSFAKLNCSDIRLQGIIVVFQFLVFAGLTLFVLGAGALVSGIKWWHVDEKTWVLGTAPFLPGLLLFHIVFVIYSVVTKRNQNACLTLSGLGVVLIASHALLLWGVMQ